MYCNLYTGGLFANRPISIGRRVFYFELAFFVGRFLGACPNPFV